MRNRLSAAGAGVVLFCGLAFGQIVTFNAPSEWLTQREPEIVAKVLFDTSRVNKKTVRFDLFVYQNAKQRKAGSSSVKVADYTGEAKLGVMPGTLFGGMDFARIDWTVVETKEKGELGPIGLVALPKMGRPDSLTCKKAAQAPTAANAVQMVGEANFVDVGGVRAGFLWDDVRFHIVCRSSGQVAAGGVSVGVDGKNAKSAFLAYADRFISVLPGDSVVLTHYERVFRKDSISYREAVWRHETQTAKGEGTLLVSVPWYDMGMAKPFVGRRFGCAIVARDARGKKTVSVPKAADYYLPGSWADMICRE